MGMKALGRHLLAEFYECNPEILDDLNIVEEYMKQSADVAGATIVNWTFHRFNPQGVSGVVVIAESHLAIHTWPEYGYAAIDLFTCGESVDPWKAFNFLKDKFQAQRVDVKEIQRGKYEEIGIPEGSSHKILTA
ncbi:MAG: S-adenosylmethionine decarboxylase [Thermotogaceae bacterium]|nr:S-adenosylmethionine decarboxylase [Thermotogaceae bacterium]MDN5338162.1 S-adenosylmethionine decarboxylase [Thermotogaceae bacterium]